LSHEKILMFLNGTAMSGQKDHHAVGTSRFLGHARTVPVYRFYAVRDEFPGLVYSPTDGASIVGELYEMDLEVWEESLMPAEPEELVPGTVELLDGRQARVMTLELSRVRPGDKLVDISHLGSWRLYQASIRPEPSRDDHYG
jgi:gamma-glutamylcyclotransferase (GGCT)/AIG2-like uncharacterized protein YtfP